MLCQLINEAYKLETGHSGVAFKTRDRLFGEAQYDNIRQHLERHEILLGANDGGDIIACVVFYEDKADPTAMRFGPFAVKPGLQGRGYGAAMLLRLEQEVIRLGRSALNMEIVNFRTDLPPFYLKHGFV